MIVPLVIERRLVAFVERYSNHGDPLLQRESPS
jgi:hypothetical protein